VPSRPVSRPVPHRLVAAIILVLGAVAAASPTARAADSVTLFAELAKPALLPNRIEWREARATGPSSLILSGVTLRLAPNLLWPEGYPIRIARAVIEDIDFDGLRRHAAPERLRLRLDGIAAGGAPFGLPQLGRLNGGAYLDYRAEPGQGLRIEHFSLELPGLAHLDLALDLGGSGARAGRLNIDTFDTLTLRSGWISYADGSLLAKVVAAEAARRHVKESTVVAEWSLVLGVALMREGGNGLSPLVAILAYLKDYRAPKGPLRITFAAPPDAPDGLPLAEMLSAGVLRTLGAKVSYAGAP